MKYDIESLTKKLNDINSERDNLNDNLRQTIDNISDLDESNVTRELKYTMYDGLDKLYE